MKRGFANIFAKKCKKSAFFDDFGWKIVIYWNELGMVTIGTRRGGLWTTLTNLTILHKNLAKLVANQFII